VNDTESIEAQTRALHHALSRTWYPFFARFGQLTETQLRAVPHILAGHDVIVSAPTASGKTEATIAPLLERILSDPERRAARPDLTLVVICPTRALCNDTRRRLTRPLSDLQWRCAVKTGDSPTFADDNPPDVLITTPESFDSMLARRPRALVHVRALVLDEIHLLAGEPRGDQLACLATRLRVIVARYSNGAHHLQTCAVSATIDEPAKLAESFLDTETPDRTYHVIKTKGDDRAIQCDILVAPSLDEVVATMRAMRRDAPHEKVLMFCNRRDDVEMLAARLSALRPFVHHGSLARDRRLLAESQFLNAESGLCIATSTLEIGIDVGNVDRAVLLGVPPNVSSFLQRIGRANRRGQVIRCTLLAAGADEVHRVQHLLSCVERGVLHDDLIPFRPSIIVQQAISLLYQTPRRWVRAEDVFARLPAPARASFPPESVDAILRHAASEGLFHRSSNGHYGEDVVAAEQFERGSMHSNIDAVDDIEAVDESTGRVVGTIGRETLERTASNQVKLAGADHLITRVVDGRVMLRKQSPNDSLTLFTPRHGPRYTFALARDLARFSGIPDNTLVYLRLRERDTLVQHYLGHIWGLLLADVIGNTRPRQSVTAVNAFTLMVRGRAPISAIADACSDIEANTRRLRDGVWSLRKKLTRKLSAGPYTRHVPEKVLHAWLVDATRVEAFAQAIATYQWIEGPDHPDEPDFEHEEF